MLAEMNVANIYDRNIGSLLQILYMSRCRGNNQHYMLANPYYKNIPIDN